MAAPKEKLLESLKILKKIQDDPTKVAIKSSDLSRVHRERLMKKGFIKEVIKGWYISSSPEEQDGDSTSWYTSYWHFCSRYLTERYGESYCLSAEQSLQIHAGNWTIPQQLIARTIAGSNKSTPLPFNTSLFSMQSTLPKEAEIVVVDGLRLVSLASSLIHCSPAMFTRNTTDVRTAFSLISDSSDILRLLLEGSHSKIAGRIVGAFRNIKQDRFADNILKTMKTLSFDVREIDPFEEVVTVELEVRDKSPYVNRIRLMWNSMRKEVIKQFPKAPGLPKQSKKYLKAIEEIYITDAYHSLSIERYRVTEELLERVQSDEWDPIGNSNDRQYRDAMAARGYWQATKKVHESLKRILNKENSGKVVDAEHGDWYRELFAPSVDAGILELADLTGYRTNQVYIGQSKHTPLNKEAVRDVMPELFDLLQNEEEASVRAVLGHFIFVYTHPYIDGNGRMGRFLMNAMLASGGYPWTVIPVEERDTYMNALESASVDQDIKPFAEFIANLVDAGLRGKPRAEVIVSSSDLG
jgi:hypothetical protein